jgi:hypothetical protein
VFSAIAAVLLITLVAIPLAWGLGVVAHTHGALAATAVLLALLTWGSPRIVTRSLGAAATADRNTDERPGNEVSLPVAAATVCYLGTLAARDANGRAVSASDTAGLRVIGRFEETADNAAGAAGAISVKIRLGVFKFDNSATQAITAAMVGRMAVVEDDQTVAATSTNLVCAGRIVGVDSDGVWVDTRHAFYGPRTLPTLTSTNGTMAAAADDAATKAEGEKIGDDVRALHSSLFG